MILISISNFDTIQASCQTAVVMGGGGYESVLVSSPPWTVAVIYLLSLGLPLFFNYSPCFWAITIIYITLPGQPDDIWGVINLIFHT